LLFVEPSAIRTGVGRALFEAAVRLVERQRGTSLSILADPFAAAFYQRQGAVKIGEAPSDAIPGAIYPSSKIRLRVWFRAERRAS